MAHKEEEKDLIEIKHLQRVKFDGLHHRDPELFKNMVDNAIQAYVIGKTMFGCFVAATIGDSFDLTLDNAVYEFQFFKFKYVMDEGIQKMTPIAIHPFEEILEICEAEYLDGLLFHLNEIKEEEKK